MQSVSPSQDVLFDYCTITGGSVRLSEQHLRRSVPDLWHVGPNVPVSEADRSYAAGLFDGEGMAGIYKSRNTFVLYVRIAMCDKEPIVWLHETWGGAYNPDLYDPRDPTWRPAFRWTVSGQRAVGFLTEIEPFVKLEKSRKRSELARAFQAEKNALRLFSRESETWQWLTTRQGQYGAASSRINQRGVHTELPDSVDEIFRSVAA